MKLLNNLYFSNKLQAAYCTQCAERKADCAEETVTETTPLFLHRHFYGQLSCWSCGSFDSPAHVLDPSSRNDSVLVTRI